MAIAFRAGVGGSQASAGAINVSGNPAGITAGDIDFFILHVPTGCAIGAPTGGGGGWVLLATYDNGQTNAAIYYRVFPVGGTSPNCTITPNGDCGYWRQAFYSTLSGAVLDIGQQGYTGSGTEPSDASDSYVYSSRGKKNMDASTDTTLAVFAGGKIAETDVAMYFYDLGPTTGVNPSVPSIGSYDTDQGSRAFGGTTKGRCGLITSTFRAEVGRGFTLDQSCKSLAFGCWATENGSTVGGGGVGNTGGIVNGAVPNAATAVDVEAEYGAGVILLPGFATFPTNAPYPGAVDVEALYGAGVVLTQASEGLKQGQQAGGVTVT